MTLHRQYLYRYHLQIAALDLLNNRQVVRTITWDPLEGVATRPLALVQGGQLYTYGLELPKNITEVYDESGNLVTTYDYTPFGAVTSTGTLNQPIQWSSEFYDEELALVYYNYRHYNPADGRWIGRDPIEEEAEFNLYLSIKNNPTCILDILGLEEKTNNYSEDHEINCQNIDKIRDSQCGILKSIGDQIGLWDALKKYSEKCKNKRIETNDPGATPDFWEWFPMTLFTGINSYNLIRSTGKKVGTTTVKTGARSGGAPGKGERNRTGSPDGTKDAYKHMRPNKDNEKTVIFENQNGKKVIKRKPEGFDEAWNNKHNK